MEKQNGLRKEGSKQGTEAFVKPLQPVARPTSVSKLTGAQIQKRISDGTNPLYTNLLKPESCTWLRGILKDLKSDNRETWLFALSRFKDVFTSVLMLKGPAQSAGFSAYALEQSILDEVKKLLKAAQKDGDVYLFAKLEAIPCAPLSKVAICLKVLHSLILDPRCARFICKAIPDLLSILEGAYFAAQVTTEGPVRRMETCVPSSCLDETKKVVLSVVASLCFWSKQPTRGAIANRKTFVRQILQDCLSRTALSNEVIERVVMFFCQLVYDCDVSYVLGDLVEVAFKALELAQTPAAVSTSVRLFHLLICGDGGCSDAFEKLLLGPRLQANKERYIVQLLALASSPSFPDWPDLKPALYNLLAGLHPSFRPLLTTSTGTLDLVPGGKANLEQLLSSNAKAVARRQQFYAMLANRAPSSSQQPAACTASVSEPHQNHPQGSRQSLGTEASGRTSYCLQEDHPDKNPRRKCSRSDCAKTESASSRFKVCSGCSIAIHCSPECQNIAWKEGHKTRCKESAKKLHSTICKQPI